MSSLNTAGTVPAQFGLGGFLEFAVLVMPSLALGGIVLLCYWGLAKEILPRLLRSPTTNGFKQPMSARRRIAIATPFVVAVTVIVAGFMRTRRGYWYFFLYLVALSGMVEGAVLVRKFAKLKSYLPDRSSDSEGDGDAGPPHRDRSDAPRHTGRFASLKRKVEDITGKSFAKVVNKVYEWLLKFWYKRKVKRLGLLMAILGALTVYVVADSRIESDLHLAELVLTTFTATVGITTLIWKLSTLRTGDAPDETVDALPLVGVLVIITSTFVVRLPDTFLPGAMDVKAIIAPHVQYPQRLVEAFLTVPFFSIGVTLVHLLGLVIGGVIAVYVLKRSGDASDAPKA